MNTLMAAEAACHQIDWNKVDWTKLGEDALQALVIIIGIIAAAYVFSRPRGYCDCDDEDDDGPSSIVP